VSERSLFLMPGDLFFGHGYQRVRTLLGSCVALTLWHPRRQFGGMCHFVLPGRVHVAGAPLDGRYGDEALMRFVELMAERNTRPDEFRVGLFGGGAMFGYTATGCGQSLNVGARNIEAARRLAAQHGLVIGREDVGGSSYRHLALDLATGVVQLRVEPVTPTLPAISDGRISA